MKFVMLLNEFVTLKDCVCIAYLNQNTQVISFNLTRQKKITPTIEKAM